MADKTRENRLRATAKRQGLLLVKSRRRDRLALDYGKWYIVEPSTSTMLLENVGIDEVEAWLLRPEKRAPVTPRVIDLNAYVPLYGPGGRLSFPPPGS